MDINRITEESSMKGITLFIVLVVAATVTAQPQPGEIFKEFVYDPAPALHFSQLDPNCTRTFDDGSEMPQLKKSVVRPLNLDLKEAIRAEVSVEYWGGHSGTADQKFRVNGNDWIMIPQPHNTPTAPQCYYRTMLGNEAVNVPLPQLRHGVNEFQFTCGAQICHNFNWGFFWVYSFTVRIYYKSSRPHPQGRMQSPVDGETIGDHTPLQVAITGKTAIKQVDYIGYYNDFDWDGNGVFTEWQFQTQYGVLRHHMAVSTCPPYAADWSNRWIPDQSGQMKIMAKITDVNGMCYTTPAVENITLVRAERSVKMYTAYEVPEKFGVRVGTMMTCNINIPDDISKATAARLVLSTWSAAHADAIGLNNKMLAEQLGCVHNYSFDNLQVPIPLLKKGINTFFIYSDTHHHAAEVNWPGPVLLVQYAN